MARSLQRELRDVASTLLPVVSVPYFAARRPENGHQLRPGRNRGGVSTRGSACLAMQFLGEISPLMAKHCKLLGAASTLVLSAALALTTPAAAQTAPRRARFRGASRSRRLGRYAHLHGPGGGRLHRQSRGSPRSSQLRPAVHRPRQPAGAEPDPADRTAAARSQGRGLGFRLQAAGHVRRRMRATRISSASSTASSTTPTRSIWWRRTR